MKTNWHKTLPDYEEGIRIGKDGVHFWGSRPNARDAQGEIVSFEAFLDGKYHDYVVKQFGEAALQEMLQSVKQRMGNRA